MVVCLLQWAQVRLLCLLRVVTSQWSCVVRLTSLQRESRQIALFITSCLILMTLYRQAGRHSTWQTGEISAHCAFLTCCMILHLPAWL